jgi:hypothetical protein
MNPTDDEHTPSLAFVRALESEVRREFRATAPADPRGAQSLLRGRSARQQRVAATLLLAVGLLIGAGGQIAYAQVQVSAQRTALEREKQLQRDLLGVQLNIAQQARALAEQSYRAGSTTRQAVDEAELEVKRRELEIQRLNVDIEEARLTAAAPRNELWAPVISGRDFVLERLRLDAAGAQEAVRVADSQLELARTAFRTGSQTANELATAEAEHARTTGAFERVALQLALRERAIRDRLSMEAVSRTLQLDEARIDYRTVQQLLTLAESRLALVQRNAAVGNATALDVKRAELAVLERRDEAGRLARQLRALERPE